MKKSKHTVEHNISRIYELCESHFGDNEVKFVGVKFEKEIGWISKVKLRSISSLVEINENYEDSVFALKKRIKKIIKRYNAV